LLRGRQQGARTGTGALGGGGVQEVVACRGCAGGECPAARQPQAWLLAAAYWGQTLQHAWQSLSRIGTLPTLPAHI
jgi:hypothetical protein